MLVFWRPMPSLKCYENLSINLIFYDVESISTVTTADTTAKTTWLVMVILECFVLCTIFLSNSSNNGTTLQQIFFF